MDNQQQAIAELTTTIEAVVEKKSQRKFARGTGSIKWEPKAKSQHAIIQTEFAKKLAKDLSYAHPEPVRIEGEAGGGKSLLMRQVAHQQIDCPTGINAVTCPNHTTVNGFIGMEMRDLTAEMVPVEKKDGIGLEPVLGVLSREVERGGSFGFEEINRAPNEILGRLMHLMDFKFRGWDLPEIRRHDFPVHKKFWFWATNNPAGGQYATNNLDKAVAGRFMQTIKIKPEELLCDEEAVVSGILGDDAELTKRVMHFVSDLRLSEETRIDTRRVCMFATLIMREMDVMDAVRTCVASYVDASQETAVITAASAHFTNK